MADDRYRWLDSDAAERLLRGLPVEARQPAIDDSGPAGDGSGGASHGITDAAALYSALDELAAGPALPASELPGEAAAVAAFRTAHAGVLRSGSVGAGRAGPGRARRRDRGSGRFARPLRAGFAMAVAGCALGGVAVVAGAGGLPGPFGGGGTPASSVSPAPNSSDGRDQQAAQGGESSWPGHSPGTGRETAGSGTPAPTESGTRGGHGEHNGEHNGRGHGAAGENGRHGNGEGRDRTGGDKRDGGRDAARKKAALARQLCTAYEEKKLSAEHRAKLERAAGGPAAVQKFCLKYRQGGGADAPSLTAGSGSSGSGGGNSGNGGGSNGGGSGDGSGDSAGVGGGTGAGPAHPGGGSDGNSGSSGGGSGGNGGGNDSDRADSSGTAAPSSSASTSAVPSASTSVTETTPAG